MSENLTLIETIAKIDKLSTFSRLMETSGANEAFRVGGDFTVLAPTNDAFCKVHDNQMNALLEEPGQTTLRSILSHHILPGKFSAAELCTQEGAPTLTGVQVKFTDSRAGLIVNESGVQASDIEATNGFVHELDTLLNYDIETYKTGPLKMPESAAASLPELVVPTISAGGTGESATNGNGAHRTGRSGRGRTFFL
jgi:uncharacterized surface protein with fasciclin (FAS1) repeats